MQTPKPSLQKMLIVALVGVLLINSVMFLCERGPHLTIGLSTTLNFLQFRQMRSDSWGIMSEAYTYLLSPHRQTVYQQIFFNEKIKFLYPLSSLLIYVPFHGYVPKLFLPVTWLCVGAEIAAAVGIYFLSQPARAGKTEATSQKWQEIVLLILLGLTFYPVLYAYDLGQIQTWLNALVAVAFWCWMRGRPGVAGVLIGLCCLIKPQYAIILLWGLLRKQGRFTLALTATFAAGLAASILVFGLHDNLDYLSVIHYVGQRGEAFYVNTTFNGLFNRALFNGPNLAFQLHTYPPVNLWVSWGTALTSLLLIAGALFWPRRDDERGQIADLMTVTLSATMASPIAWDHHYGILLPIYALLLPRLRQTPVWGRATLPLLALSYLPVADYLPVMQRLALTHWNVLQSYLLFGALLALGMLYGLQRRGSSQADTSQADTDGRNSIRLANSRI